MKCLNFLSAVILILSLSLLPSCGDDEAKEEGSCVNDVFGVWKVDSFTPTSANCATLTTYTVGPGSSKNILSLSIVDGSRTFSGSGFIDDNCTEMAYTLEEGQTIIGGDIRFNGSNFEDRSRLGCLVYATKL